MEQRLPLVREPTVDPGAFSVKRLSFALHPWFVDSSILILLGFHHCLLIV